MDEAPGRMIPPQHRGKPIRAADVDGEGGGEEEEPLLSARQQKQLKATGSIGKGRPRSSADGRYGKSPSGKVDKKPKAPKHNKVDPRGHSGKATLAHKRRIANLLDTDSEEDEAGKPAAASSSSSSSSLGPPAVLPTDGGSKRRRLQRGPKLRSLAELAKDYKEYLPTPCTGCKEIMGVPVCDNWQEDLMQRGNLRLTHWICSACDQLHGSSSTAPSGDIHRASKYAWYLNDIRTRYVEGGAALWASKIAEICRGEERQQNILRRRRMAGEEKGQVCILYTLSNFLYTLSNFMYPLSNYL